MKKIYFSVFIYAATCGLAGASSIDFFPINFKVSMPSRSDDLKSSLNAPWDTYLKLLQANASLLKSVQTKYRFKVVGFTDSHECKSNECNELSLRRATFVYNWLIDNGVSPDELDSSEGRGSQSPLGSNDSPSGRQRNRRVEIDFIVR
jgi:outer membrane protein OmpA-like peptidoglycan-associated protein